MYIPINIVSFVAAIRKWNTRFLLAVIFVPIFKEEILWQLQRNFHLGLGEYKYFRIMNLSGSQMDP